MVSPAEARPRLLERCGRSRRGGLADDLADGLEMATAAIEDGNAKSALDRLAAVSNAAAEADFA